MHNNDNAIGPKIGNGGPTNTNGPTSTKNPGNLRDTSNLQDRENPQDGGGLNISALSDKVEDPNREVYAQVRRPDIQPHTTGDEQIGGACNSDGHLDNELVLQHASRWGGLAEHSYRMVNSFTKEAKIPKKAFIGGTSHQKGFWQVLANADGQLACTEMIDPYDEFEPGKHTPEEWEKFLDSAYTNWCNQNKMGKWFAGVLKSEDLNDMFMYDDTKNDQGKPALAKYNEHLYWMMIAKILPFHADFEDFFGILEYNDTNVLHAHIMFKWARANARIDTVQRLLSEKLEKGCNITKTCVITFDCIKFQTVKSLPGLCNYFLKNPISICTGKLKTTEAMLSKALLIKKHPVETSISNPKNPFVRTIMHLMEEHKVYTAQELMRVAPSTMVEYLGRRDLSQVIQNCSTFMNTKTDIASLKKRFTAKDMWGSLKIFHFLKYQGIDINAFEDAFYKWIFQTESKKNTLIFEGPSNTGKTSFIRPLSQLVRWSEISSAGDFMFSNCTNKEIILWEEPLISANYSDKMKLVMEGQPTQINVKHSDSKILERTPLLFTTNKPLWKYSSMDEQAFRNRSFIFYFNKSLDSNPRNNATGEPIPANIGEVPDISEKYRNIFIDHRIEAADTFVELGGEYKHSTGAYTSFDGTGSQPSWRDYELRTLRAISKDLSGTDEPGPASCDESTIDIDTRSSPGNGPSDTVDIGAPCANSTPGTTIFY